MDLPHLILMITKVKASRAEIESLVHLLKGQILREMNLKIPAKTKTPRKLLSLN